jgi:pimeloyl-ACP methyl ester carboxylesterase
MIASRIVDVAGVAVSYRETGDLDGPPVVLLHGGGSSAGTWDAFAAVLAGAGRRVIAADLRGHGGTARAVSYSLAGFRDDVVGLLDVLELDRVALVGHSLGAHTASLIAQCQPDRVARLVLEDPPAPSRDVSLARELSAMQVMMLAIGSVLRRRRYHPVALISAIRELRVPDPGWWQRLSLITAPTLVISGGASSHLSPQRIAEVAEAIPDAELVTIPVGHRVHSVAPDRFCAVVVPFLIR